MVILSKIQMKLKVKSQLFSNIFFGNDETFHTVNIICPFFSHIRYPYFSWEFYVVTVALGGKWRDPSPAPSKTGTTYNCWKMSPYLITSDLYYCKRNPNEK